MSPTRLEAFSDGVIAIAITLLVLNIHVPAPRAGTSLAHELAKQWPSYAAYLTSFLTIGIIWINHHAMIRRLRTIDHTVMTLNLLLLLTIGVLPFTTALAAEYLKQGHGQHLAAGVYSGSYLLMSIAFAATNRYILLGKPSLHRVALPEAQCREILRRSLTGLVPYALATALAVLSPYVTLAICGAIAVYYALPIASADSASASAA
ncbi:MAG TPA: TMEM175 family protein [Solirubrobacteraceae bacterium]|nr:TMEM175 family protein [Solirubrobacteraceae bacterium]